MSVRDSYYAALLEIRNARPVAVETRFRGSRGPLTDLSRTVCRVRPSTEGVLTPTFTSDPDGDCSCYTDSLTPPERLIILGGGHIAVPLCDFAAKCGFGVTVVDDRPEFAAEERFPGAERVLCGPFARTVGDLRLTGYDFVVIVTRGHQHDADCVRAVLKGREPAYTGMIGSRRRVGALLELLRGEGLDPERLGRICTPIGLPIGAVSPAEISVSILSQLIEYRRLKTGPRRFLNRSDLDLPVLEELMEKREPLVLATIVETKGSTPRNSGAMMFMDPDGRIRGSVGGGAGEAIIMKEAREILGTGTYRLVFIDMTGSVAEREGMACGGTMRVLVEDVPPDVYDD